MITWINRNDGMPRYGEDVLAWGDVPSLNGDVSIFLGTAQRNGELSFNLDRTGHFGLNRVTHWAEINGPGKTE